MRKARIIAIIQDTVGTLPCLITDLDQHSCEAEDCFTRCMPKVKLDTAIRAIMTPSGREVLLANDSPSIRMLSPSLTQPLRLTL